MDLWQTLKSYNYPIKSGLNYKNEFTFLIAIILSAQAKDSFINTQTPELFNEYFTPEVMQELSFDELAWHIRKIGLWRNKAKNILQMTQQIIKLKKIENLQNWYETFQGEDDDLTLYGPILSREGIPGFRAGLLQLAGIGRKSANVFLNVIYNAPVFPVDTHVKRLSNRLQLSSSTNVNIIEQDLKETVPNEYASSIAHYLVWHGRNICTARNPKCTECKLSQFCGFFTNNFS